MSLTSALELCVVDAGQLFAAHAVWILTSRSTRLDRVYVQVGGQPLQVAVTDERVARQVSENTSYHTQSQINGLRTRCLKIRHQN